MKLEELQNQRNVIKEAVDEALKKMIESSDDADVAKFDNLMKKLEAIDEKIKNEEALEEKNKTLGNQNVIGEGDKGNKDKLTETQRFANNLREAMTKGSTFTGKLPREVASTIQQKKRELAKLRGLCTVHQATGEYTVYIEGNDVTVAYATEGSSLTETTPTIAPMGLSALKLGALIKLSREYMEDLGVDVMGYITEKIAKAYAAKEDLEILKGAGTSSDNTAMRGIITNCASDKNIATASATAITWKEVKDVINAIGAYASTAHIILNRSTLNAIAEFKDGSEYIFPQNQQITQIMGVPVVICDQMDGIAAGKAVIVVGDFSYYHILDRDSMEIVTLNELYAAQDMIGVKVTERIDGDFFSDAFAVLTCKSA